MRGGDKDEGEKRCVNIGGRGRFLYTAISLFSLLSNWNEFFEIEILEIFFARDILCGFFFFSLFFLLIIEYQNGNGIFSGVLRINQDFRRYKKYLLQTFFFNPDCENFLIYRVS